MLWIGLVVLVFAGIAAANGHVSPIALGGGLGLVVLWYLFERERAVPPATENELVELSAALHESSTEFDLADFPVFLRRIAPHITRGFGAEEIEKLTVLATRLPHNGESQKEFQVVFQGTATPLRVQFFKDDPDAIGVAFFTSEPLVALLDREMDAFFTERGM
jgi:hypothetical protein